MKRFESLSEGRRDGDVAELQERLVALGFKIESEERESKLFGASTLKAVRKFQKERGIERSGVVDRATADALAAAPGKGGPSRPAEPSGDGAGRGLIVGRVITSAATSVPDAEVKAFSVGLGGEEEIAKGGADSSGEFRLEYPRSRLVARGRRPDLRVRAALDGSEIGASEIRFNAPDPVAIDVIVEPEAIVRGDEHGRLLGDLQPLLEAAPDRNRLGELEETEERRDITFLANKTGWDARAVAMAAAADQLAADTELPGELFYALFRAGLPANRDVLARTRPEVAVEIWKQSIESGIVSPELKRSLKRFAKEFGRFASTSLLERPAIGTSSLGEILEVAGLGEEERQKVAAAYTTTPKRTDFWEAVEEQLGREGAERVATAGKLAYLTVNNAPLAERLMKTVDSGDPVALVRDGLYDPAAWSKLLGDTPVPAEIPGEDESERRANYAELLAGQLEISYPTAVVAAMIEREELPLGEPGAAGEVVEFLTESQGRFELGERPVESYLKEQGIELGEGALRATKALQRQYQMTPSRQAMKAIASKGVDSAYAVSRYDEGAFVANFAEALGGEETARLVHVKAQQIHMATVNVATGYLMEKTGPTLYGVPAPTEELQSTSAALTAAGDGGGGTAGDVIAYATLEQLFGELDYCSCSHCRSVLSPAAYLVDLLMFCDRRRFNAGGVELPADYEKENPLDVLLSRRPDLAELKLTCENTNVALPYVDLVNEVLEHFVVNKSIEGFRGHDVGPEQTSEQLIASPSFTDPAAYATLAEQSYPLLLPFHRPLAALRAYVGRVEVTLAEAMEGLRSSDAMQAGGEAAYGWRDILIERLGINRGEHRLLTDASVPLAELFGDQGANDAATIASIANAKTFARRLDLDYEELVELTRTRFVNPQSRLLPRLERLAIGIDTIKEHHDGLISDAELEARLPSGLDTGPYDGDPLQWLADHYEEIGSLIVLSDPDGEDLCSFEAVRLRHAVGETDLTPVEARRMLRFVRLQRRLGWKTDEVDRALTALWPAAQRPASGDSEASARTKLDAGFAEVLLRLGHLRQAMDVLGLNVKRDLQRALALWAPIDTIGPASLYRRMFLAPAVAQPDPAFAEDASGEFLTSGSAKLADHRAALEAAFSLKGDELDAILAALGFDQETSLSLANVSAVFRWGLLARRLKLSVRELVALTEMTGIDPFAEPVSPRPPLARLLEAVERLREAGLRLPFLMNALQHDLQRGAPRPPEIGSLAKALHDELGRIEEENAPVEDPDGDLARARMALVYGQETAERFMSLLTGSVGFDVAYAQVQPGLDATVLAAAPGLSYDHLAKRLRHSGLLSEAERDAVQALAAATPALSTAVAALFSAGEEATDAFFTAYPELRELHDAVAAKPPAERPAEVLAEFLPELRRRLQQLYLLQVLASDADLAPADVDRLLRNPDVMHADGDASAPVLDDLMTIGRHGASMTVFDGADTVGTPSTEEDAVERLDFEAPDRPLPANSADATGSVSGVWRWRLDPPANGFYAFSIDADASATVALEIDGAPVSLAQNGGLWETQDPIELKAGELPEMRLTVKKARNRMVVRWQSAGLALEPIPTDRMLPANFFDRFEAGYVRLLKLLGLASELELDGEEIAWFATRPELQVGGEGWLNALPVAAGVATATVRGLFTAVLKLGAYAQLRRELKLRDRRLLDLLRDPGATTDQGASVRSELTGWPDAEVAALLAHFGLAESDLDDVDELRRVKRALDLADEVGVPAATLIATLGNNPSEGRLADFQGALRARYDEEAWNRIAQPVNDGLRDAQRDALVAYVVHQLRSQPETAHIDTPNKLFEWFLLDVEMESCMKTSRIRQALSSVQLFIQRCLLNLEPRVAASSIDPRRWSWMQRYRVWEANRKVFLMPENWLEPELRDDKSPLFKKLESDLLAADITEESAARALGGYLEGLSEVAKLEVDGMFVEEGSTGAADDIVHVIGRTAGARRKYFYRRQSRSAWTAWEAIPLDIEDSPAIPVVWRGRLFVFWLRVLEGSPPPGKATTGQAGTELADVKASEVQTTAKRKVVAMLQWSERFNGAWQPPRTSDPGKPLVLDEISVDAFDRGKLGIFAGADSDGTLRVDVSYGTNGSHFRLFTPHSLPVRAEDEPPVEGKGSLILYLLQRGRSFRTGKGLSVDYFDPYGGFLTFSHDVLHRGNYGRVVAPSHPLDDVFAAPFFYEDRRHLLFVRPETSIVKVPQYGDIGIQPEAPTIKIPELPQIVLIPEITLEDLIPEKGDPYPEVVYHGGFDSTPVPEYVGSPNIRAGIATVGTFAYGDTEIAPDGGIAREIGIGGMG